MKLSDIVSQRLVYGPIRDHNINDLFQYGCDEDVSRFIGWPLLKSIDDATSFHQQLIEKEKAKTHMYCTIAEKDLNTHMGTMMLFSFNEEARNAEIGYVLHQGYWGNGYVSEAVAATINFAREQLNLHKLSARVVDVNIGSAIVLEKNGFSLEGTLKDHYLIDGNYYDCLVYGFILEE